ncbi:MAG: S8 family serine peptidase, partial [Nocardioidaceae bacterium]
YLSPRDGIGHGTRVASVAAGDYGTGVRIDAQQFGSISGMAPAARIAVYKACWTAPDPDGDGCTTADTVAAIDRAVRDGVDVLNLSVSGSQDPTDTVARAFLNAAAAGVFVSTSAGNDGPEPGTVQHLAPWVTTVGASTFHRYQGALRLGDGTEYVGAMVSDRAVPSTRLVLGSAVPAPGHTAEQARLCEIGALDAERAQGQIVVCDRGVVARVDKSTAVARAGGAGMVLVNTTPDSTDADVHSVPTVHLDATAGAAVKTYLADHPNDATASLDPTGSAPQPVPTIADFSARGGDPSGSGNLLKPDLTAPGVSVLGATSPAADSQRLWDLSSGTSMSAAHVAGLAAFVAGQHADWTPAEIKSAMMTTGFDLQANAGPFAEGAGHVDPTRFLDPGLVFDSGPAAWRGYLSGEVGARRINLPSVAVSGLLGSTTVVRRLTNVAATTETYTATTTGLDGVDVQIRPHMLTLAPGESHRVRIRLTATPNTPSDHYTKGWLTWTGLSHQVRVPVVVDAATVQAPSLLRSTGSSGSLSVHGRSGNSLPVDLTSTGMVPANPTGLTLVPGAFDPRHPTSDADTFETSVQVPAGSDLVRVELSSHNAGDDMDAYLFRDGRPVAADTGTGPDAALTLSAPQPGRYSLFVHAQSAGNHATTTAQLYTWVLADQGGSSVDLTPDTVDSVPGGSLDYTVSWQGLDPTQRWLGEIHYGESSQHTLLQVN